MRLTRLYEPQPLAVQQTIQLGDFAAKHIAQALRGKVGDPVILFNGTGGEYHAIIKIIKKTSVFVEVAHFNSRECESPLTIQLAQAISRGHKMDYTLQKATELGVSSITPLITAGNGVKHNAAYALKRWQHWHRIISSACEQCGRNRLPILQPITPLTTWLPHVTEAVRLLLYHRSASSLRYDGGSRQSVVLLVGAEGGFNNAEIDAAQQFNFQTVQLGPRVLRTETAALTALSLLQYMSGDL